MEKLIQSKKLNIKGEIHFYTFYHDVQLDTGKEILEIVFIQEDQLIYLRFYENIISYRYRECYSGGEYIDKVLQNDEQVNLHMDSRIYQVENSEYIKKLSEEILADKSVNDIIHYVVMDTFEECYLDILSTSIPEVIYESMGDVLYQKIYKKQKEDI